MWVPNTFSGRVNVYVEDGYLKIALFSKPTDNHEHLNVRCWHQDSVFRSFPTTVANRIRRNCTNDSEFTKSRSEYSGYLTNADYKTDSIDKAFSDVENLSQKTLAQKTKEKQLKATTESCNDNSSNSSNSSNRISSFTPIYHPIIKDVHKVIRNTLESSDSLKHILPINSIKLSSKRDRNLKEILTIALPHAHRKKKERKRRMF